MRSAHQTLYMGFEPTICVSPELESSELESSELESSELESS